MRKKIRFMMTMIFIMVLIRLVSYENVYAEEKLEQGIEKKYDLDGNGSKEEISFSKSINSYLEWVGVYVNGARLYTYINEYQNDYYDASVSIYDINPADKFKEIVVEIIAEFNHSYYAYRYNNGKLKLLFSEEDEINDFQLLPKQKKGKKVLAYDAVDCALGNHVTIIKNFKVKNKKLVEVKPKTGIYKVAYDYAYTSAKKIPVYKNTGDKSAIMTIKKGTKFIITKLKYANDGKKYAMVKLKGKENVGWIDVSYYDGCSWNDPLVENPGFAG